MIGHALLAVIAAETSTDHSEVLGMIALTCAEARRLYTTLIVEPARALACSLAWSRWRRHQHRARTSHYQRQQAT